MKIHIHARALKYFDMIRRCGSIREAARQLHVASSAVNRQLLQLEEEIGSPLFERMPAGMKLTAAGEVFSRHVITVMQDELRMVGELESLKGIRRGSLSIVCAESLNTDLLPTVLQQMLTRYPLVRIQASTAGSMQAATVVAEGDADVAIGFAVERTEVLTQSAVARFELGAVVRTNHPLASLPEVAFAECARYPLILPSPELSTHAVLRPVLAHHKRARTVVLETASLELAKSMVDRGVGVTFQSPMGIERELDEGRFAHVPLRAPGPVLTELGAYVRAGRTLPAVLDAFLRILDEELRKREAAAAAAVLAKQARAQGEKPTIEHASR